VRPLVVCEDPDDDASDLVAEFARNGWTIREGWDVAGGVPDRAKIVLVGDVRNDADASAAVLAAVWGTGVVVRARASRDVLDRLCEDLRRIGPVEHFTGPRPKQTLDAEQRSLLALLVHGCSLGEAASQLHLSRRTADRRLAAAREALGVETTAQALVEARRLNLI
jgi:DNA-binding NarL/FixJ family response regulator